MSITVTLFEGTTVKALQADLATTSSYTQHAINADTASVVLGSIESASYAAYAVSSSYAVSASWAPGASAISSSYADTALSASYAQNATTADSASYASTASFALNGGSGVFGGNFSGSFSGSVTGSFTGDGTNISGIVSASYASVSLTATSSSYAVTSSYATAAILASTASVATGYSGSISASGANIVFPYRINDSAVGDRLFVANTTRSVTDAGVASGQKVPALFYGEGVDTTLRAINLISTHSGSSLNTAVYAQTNTAADYIPGVGVNMATIYSNTFTFINTSGFAQIAGHNNAMNIQHITGSSIYGTITSIANAFATQSTLYGISVEFIPILANLASIYGLYVKNSWAVSTVDNYYGIYIQDVGAVTGSLNHFAIWTDGQAPSRFGPVTASSATFNGNLRVTGSVSASSFIGDGSQIHNVISSSYALTTAPIISSSYALTSSFASNALTANSATTATSASYASVATTVSPAKYVQLTGDTMSGALTITGSLNMSGAINALGYDITGSSIHLDGLLQLNEQTHQPATPPHDHVAIYSHDVQEVHRLAILDDKGVVLFPTQDSVIIVQNGSGLTLSSSQAVNVISQSAGLPVIGLAIAQSSSADTNQAAGVILETLAAGAYGRVMRQGVLYTDTTGYTIGDNLWVSQTTSGSLTTTEPTYPLLSQFIGRVTNVGTAGTGSIAINTAPLAPSLALSQLADVSVASPLGGNVLTWNGVAWVNTNIPAGGGASVVYFPESSSISGSLNLLRTAPSGVSEAISEVTVISSSISASVCLAQFIAPNPIGSSIQGGVWEFITYAAKPGGTNNGNIFVITRVNKVVLGSGSVTFTGSGVNRVATVTGATPFVSSDTGSGVTVITATMIQTPLASLWISSYSSSAIANVVTNIALPGYVNESAVSYSLHYYLFSVSTPTLTGTTVAEYDVSTTQPDFTLGSTDRISIGYFAQSDNTSNAKTIDLYYGGTTHGSHITTPIALGHNSLSGLQGGQSGQYYHLTQAEYINLEAGSASFATNALTANSATSATTATTATSASYATTASYASVAQTLLGSVVSASYALTASNAAYAQQALSASWAPGTPTTSASYADVAKTVSPAKYVQLAGDSMTGGLTISGTLLVSGAINTSPYPITGSAFKGDGTQITGVISASFAQTALTANSATTATSASFASNALTANSATTATSASYASVATTISPAKYVQLTGDSMTGGLTISGTLLVSGAINTSPYPITGSAFKGDGTQITGVVSASFASTALSASYAPGSPSVSSSYALTASYAAVSSYSTDGRHLRLTYTVSSSALAPTYLQTGSVALGQAFVLFIASSSTDTRLRLYSTTASLASDYSRPLTQDPSGGVCLFEAIFTGSSKVINLAPTVYGYNGEVVVTNSIPFIIENLSAVTASLSVVLRYSSV